MNISKIINKILSESEGVEEFYEVEEYVKDTLMEQDIKKLAIVLRPFIQRVAKESMYIIDRNKKEIRNILFDFIQTYLEDDSNNGFIDTQVETVKTEEQDHYPIDFNKENKYRLIIFLLNLFSNYINDYEGGNINNEKIIRNNKELIRMDLIHFIQVYLEESDDINENTIDMLSEALNYHIDNRISLTENIYRPFSDEFFNVINEARVHYNNGTLHVDKNDLWLVESDFGKRVRLSNGEIVRLDVPYVTENLNEAEYQGKKVKIGYPMRGGSKKYHVFVKNPSTGKVKKISFGDVHGGLTAKVSNPKARSAFAARHNCKAKKDRMTAGYWACRINRYGHLWGGKTYGGYW